MSALKKIGYFGGSFDPIHIGHISLAVDILEKKQLDEIWFCPTCQSPIKHDVNGTIEHRMKMVELAISPYRRFKIIDLESKMGEPFYTYNTLKKLKTTHPSFDFSFIICDDHIPTLHKWHNVKKLFEEFGVIIGKRYSTQRGQKKHAVENESSLSSLLSESFVDIRAVEVSSTEIRLRIKEKLEIEHLLPPKVLDYIRENAVYS